jgi:NAD(P)-dependent dehydrogenase (short-subunit alcohol dehydrogenase family)
VTGGNGGIGRAIAQRLQAEGARVTVLDTRERSGACADPSGLAPIGFRQLDVSSEDAVDAAFGEIAEHEGAIDYLVCCAAVFPRRPFLELSVEDWQRTLAVNLTGSFLCCRAAFRVMLPRRFGRIVLFASGLARSGGVASAHYSASKGGVLGLARSLALEGASENVRVNVLSPGLTETPQPLSHMSREQFYALAGSVPLGRVAQPEDMVEPCLFLLGPDASYVTGQDLRVNGGLVML